MGGQRARCQAVNSKHDVLLSQHFLPAIKEMSADCFTFQQDSAPARETVALLTRETPTSFIQPSGHPTVRISILWTTISGVGYKSESTGVGSET